MARARSRLSAASRHFGLAICLVLGGCAMGYEGRQAGQWDSKDQVLLSEESQVKLRAAQSRLFATTDRTRLLAAIIATMQDLGFMIEVLDEELGIVSGQKLVPIEGPSPSLYPVFGDNRLIPDHYIYRDPSYHLYDDQSLLAFSRAYRGMGPFHHRSDLVRLTVTVRQRNEGQTVVRASAQFYMAALEDPEPYQEFFRSIEKALFLEAQRVDGEG